MNIAYTEENLTRRTSYKDFKKLIIAVFITTILFILLYLNINKVVIEYPHYETYSYCYDCTSPIVTLPSNSSNPTSETYYILSPYFPYILFLFILSVTISITLGIGAMHAKPRNLSEIVINSYLKKNDTYYKSQEEILFGIEDGILKIRWLTNKGSVHNWKLILTLYVPKITNSLALIRLPYFLLMNEVVEDSELYSENKKYQKIIFVHEWARQEYIIYFWLKNFKNT